MNCSETYRLLNGYVDGELELGGSLAVEEHLAGCPRCRAREANLRSLGSLMRGHVELDAAPERLRARLRERYGARSSTWQRWRPWHIAFAATSLAALTLAAWIGIVEIVGQRAPLSKSAGKVVYHITNSSTASAALRTLRNHLEASPDVTVVVVAHNEGIDFLLRGARDSSGQLYEGTVRGFKERGVDFRVCNNTLVRRKIDSRDIVPEATLVPSGIAEISRLQGQEGYTYMRL